MLENILFCTDLPLFVWEVSRYGTPGLIHNIMSISLYQQFATGILTINSAFSFGAFRS